MVRTGTSLSWDIYTGAGTKDSIGAVSANKGTVIVCLMVGLRWQKIKRFSQPYYNYTITGKYVQWFLMLSTFQSGDNLLGFFWNEPTNKFFEGRPTLSLIREGEKPAA